MRHPAIPYDKWMRLAYRTIYINDSGQRGTITTNVPILMIRARVAGPQAQTGPNHEIINQGMIDTGAVTSMIPLWAANRLRLSLDEGSKRRMVSVSGWFDAYQTVIGLDVSYNGKWVEVGDIDTVVPDTKMSRDPAHRQPFLLGRGGFLEKFQMFMDEAEKEVWLRKRVG